jgi:hypothetical protein
MVQQEVSYSKEILLELLEVAGIQSELLNVRFQVLTAATAKNAVSGI